MVASSWMWSAVALVACILCSRAQAEVLACDSWCEPHVQPWSTKCSFSSCLGCEPCLNSTTLKLGFLWPLSQPSNKINAWAAEAFSLLKLALKHVNERPDVLPEHKLSFEACNTEASSEERSRVAYVCTLDLLEDEDIVGLVGTGYSSNLLAPAILSSVSDKPIISPASTDPAFASKVVYPLLLRSVASRADRVRGLAAAIIDLGWQNIAVISTMNNLGTTVSSPARPAWLQPVSEVCAHDLL